MRLAGKAVISWHEPIPQPVGPPARAVLSARLAKKKASGKARQRVCRALIEGAIVVAEKRFCKSPFISSMFSPPHN
jgi:hypothetical protein